MSAKKAAASANAGAKTVRKKNKVVFKPYLNSPYSPELPPALESEAAVLVRQAFKKAFAPLRRATRPHKRLRDEATAAASAAAAAAAATGADASSLATAGSVKATAAADVSRSDKMVRLGGVLILGLNEATRELERGRVAALVVSADEYPRMLTRHLVPLAYTKGVPLCTLGDLSGLVREVLGVRARLVVALRASALDKERQLQSDQQQPKPTKMAPNLLDTASIASFAALIKLHARQTDLAFLTTTSTAAATATPDLSGNTATTAAAATTTTATVESVDETSANISSSSSISRSGDDGAAAGGGGDTGDKVAADVKKEEEEAKIVTVAGTTTYRPMSVTKVSIVPTGTKKSSKRRRKKGKKT